jgi:glycosyltransferase involved in cell wall biosynthesis
VLAVVPCLNEQEALPPLLAQLRATAQALASDARLDVLVVDDGSTDRTAAIARAGGARVVRLCRNLGIGAAVQTGLRFALREGYDCAVQIDGDGQHPPDELRRLLAPLAQPEAPDLVIGSRFVDRGGDGWKSTRLRRVGISWLAFVLRTFVGARVSDPTSGFRVYGRRALALFDDNYPYDYPEPESVALAKAAGLTIREVPIKMQERQGGASSIRGLKTAYYMLKVTLAVLLTFVRNAGTRGRRRRGET